MTNKSPDAFRTISEVADWLGVPTHVLRFWESRFSQVKPVKRAGGRRYYRPADMELLGGIRTLLHEDGMTIRGVQKLLRESGIKHVAAMSPGLDDTSMTEAKPSNIIELETASNTEPDHEEAPETIEAIEDAEIIPDDVTEPESIQAEAVAEEPIEEEAPAQEIPESKLSLEEAVVTEEVEAEEFDAPLMAEPTEAAEHSEETPDPVISPTPQVVDISHIAADPSEEEALDSEIGDSLVSQLRATRQTNPSFENNPELGAIVLRLTILKSRMKQDRANT